MGVYDAFCHIKAEPDPSVCEATAFSARKNFLKRLVYRLGRDADAGILDAHLNERLTLNLLHPHDHLAIRDIIADRILQKIGKRDRKAFFVDHNVRKRAPSADQNTF